MRDKVMFYGSGYSGYWKIVEDTGDWSFRFYPIKRPFWKRVLQEWRDFISGKSLFVLAAKRRVGVWSEEILSVSFWKVAVNCVVWGSWSEKRIIRTFGKADWNCCEKDFSCGFASESGAAVILILFSVRWLMISEQRVRAEASNQMEHSE